jgi:hypothetical protein
MPLKKNAKNAWMDDGDSAHWVDAKPSKKKGTKKVSGVQNGAAKSGWTEKPAQKGSATRKKMAAKK